MGDCNATLEPTVLAKIFASGDCCLKLTRPERLVGKHMETNTAAVDSPVAKQKLIVGRFSGMLGAFQLNAYNTLIACKVNNVVAHKIAVDFGSDVGRMMKSDPDLASKVSKANKDGMSKLTIKGGGKIATSPSMSVVRLAQQMHELYKEGLIAERDLPQVPLNLQEYIGDSEHWAQTQDIAS